MVDVCRSLGQHERLMEQLIEKVGEEWLEQEAPKPDRPEHPLAKLIRVARATPSHDRLNNEQFLLLTRIAFDLDVLRKASVAGTEEKVLGLTASSEEKVYAAAGAGHRVADLGPAAA